MSDKEHSQIYETCCCGAEIRSYFYLPSDGLTISAKFREAHSICRINNTRYGIKSAVEDEIILVTN